MSQYFIEDKNIKSNLKLNKVKIRNISFSFYTDTGLFNKKGLDLGTKILLENILLSNKNTFLDLGCGCGPIGIYLGIINKSNYVDMVDINQRAIDVSKKSVKLNNLKNNVFKSDGFENIEKNYDCITLNPPIHAGKIKVYKLINDALNHLNSKGELWVIIRKKHGAESLINDFKSICNIELVLKDHGFWLLKMSNNVK